MGDIDHALRSRAVAYGACVRFVRFVRWLSRSLACFGFMLGVRTTI